MRVNRIEAVNFKCFPHLVLKDLSQVNVLIGPNNAGKSAVLRALFALQEQSGVSASDIRRGSTEARIRVWVDAVNDEHFAETWGDPPPNVLEVTIPANSAPTYRVTDGQTRWEVRAIPGKEPNNWIYPFLSRRKVYGYDESVNIDATNQVTPDLRYIAAKIARLNDPSHVRYGAYVDACRDVIGFVPSSVASINGRKPGVSVGAFESIHIEAMGEGVANLVGLIADLCIAENRLLLIEEPENDIHPRALKRLLELLARSSEQNQMFVTTHSHIVAKHLGGVPGSQVLYVDRDSEASEANAVPTSSVRVVVDTEDRVSVLRDLGYELFDFDLWEGWLFLEESSAERIINDLLIPWFAPKLARVRTVSLGGAGQVEPGFADYHRLFLFAHLENRYRGRAWVVVDGDLQGEQIAERLQHAYASWDPSHFRCWKQHNFERYYPARFESAASAVLEISHKEKRAAKRALLEEVLEWAEEATEEARGAFEISALEVIEFLREVETRLGA